eukprot:GHVN01020424.1.p1 GENE.GHVN01020424.1~~GHVN01020424.1.p1  ORF type:complete len:168 (-),score=8.97 GHVN01020424.1:1127-1630(-)
MGCAASNEQPPMEVEPVRFRRVSVTDQVYNLLVEKDRPNPRWDQSSEYPTWKEDSTVKHVEIRKPKSERRRVVPANAPKPKTDLVSLRNNQHPNQEINEARGRKLREGSSSSRASTTETRAHSSKRSPSPVPSLDLSSICQPPASQQHRVPSLDLCYLARCDDHRIY